MVIFCPSDDIECIFFKELINIFILSFWITLRTIILNYRICGVRVIVFVSNAVHHVFETQSDQTPKTIKVITKLPNSEQSYKGKVQTHNYINRQNQSATGKLKTVMTLTWYRHF